MLPVSAPVPGHLVTLAEVPDPVFSAALVGPGCAVDPVRSRPLTAVSPVAGWVAKLHPHAFVVTSPDGRGVLVHLGIDTMQLEGTGFELLLAEGAEVEPGTPVVGWNPSAVEAGGRSPVVPVVALDAQPHELAARRRPGPVMVGDRLFEWAR